MSKYLILGNNKVDGYDKYKGTYRTTPYYVDNECEDSEVNQHFFWYVDEIEQFGFLSNLEKTKKMVELYNKLASPIKFDLVRITESRHETRIEEEFLGFDLCDRYHYSLLSWNLDIGLKKYKNDKILKMIEPLINLVREYFKPVLNRYGLFDDIETAQFCLDCMMSLQDIRPGLWENEDFKFEVTGLSRIIK